MSAERDEFVAFYEGARDDCLRAVLVSVCDRDAAEDLVAEAFARAWASWRTVRVHPAPRAWVVRTALNARVSAWRRRWRETPAATPPQAAVESPLQSAGVDPALMACLRSLPLRQREVVALRIFLDLDTAETARALGIAPGTVTAHLARATASLRAAYSTATTTT